MLSRELTKLGNEERQEIEFVLSNGNSLFLNFYFNINTNFWYLNIEYEDFKYNGIQVVYHDNLLRQFSNLLPFGIQIYSTNGLSPMTINSFIDGSCKVVINEF